jgi:hypothetical protein
VELNPDSAATRKRLRKLIDSRSTEATVRYNPRMKNDDWFRQGLLAKYETGIWVLLIVAVAAFLGLILWMGYTILL